MDVWHMIKRRIVRNVPLTPDEQRKRLGLGDAFEMVAQPVAKAADVILGTNLSNCGGCAQRKDRMNQAVPDINPLNLLK